MRPRIVGGLVALPLLVSLTCRAHSVGRAARPLRTAPPAMLALPPLAAAPVLGSAMAASAAVGSASEILTVARSRKGAASNVAWGVPTDTELLLTGSGTLPFYARRDIVVGDELLASYGDDYWRDRGITPW